MQTSINNLKCSLKGHDNSPYTYICLSNFCKENERLLCTKCALNHGHAQNYILIEDLLNKNEFTMENWPQDESGRKVKNLILWNTKGQA